MALTKVTGNGLGAVTQDGAATFNEGSADVDFRVESDGITHALFLEGSSSNVGLGATSLAHKLNLRGFGTSFIHLGHTGTAADTEVGRISSNTFDVNNASYSLAEINFVTTSANGSTGFISFRTNSVNSTNSRAAERMRISSVGRQTFNGSSTANGHGNFVGEVGSSSKAIMFEHTNGGGETGSITTGSSSAAYNTSSDYRLKENVDYTWDATTRLKQLKPARFNFIIDADKTVDGFLAHEVSSIVPAAISGEKDAVDSDGKPEHQVIDHSKLVPLLVKTIQELEARITALE